MVHPISTLKGVNFFFAVKGVNFFGPRSEYIVSGSDCSHIFLWEKETEKVVQFLLGDEAGVVSLNHVFCANIKVFASLSKSRHLCILVCKTNRIRCLKQLLL